MILFIFFIYYIFFPLMLYGEMKRLFSTSGVRCYHYKNVYLKQTKEQERKATCLHLVSWSRSWDLFL